LSAEAVTRERLVKAQQAGKDLACAVAINPISNQKLRREFVQHVTIFIYCSLFLTVEESFIAVRPSQKMT
jgi:hypothetical protein